MLIKEGTSEQRSVATSGFHSGLTKTINQQFSFPHRKTTSVLARFTLSTTPSCLVCGATGCIEALFHSFLVSSVSQAIHITFIALIDVLQATLTYHSNGQLRRVLRKAGRSDERNKAELSPLTHKLAQLVRVCEYGRKDQRIHSIAWHGWRSVIIILLLVRTN